MTANENNFLAMLNGFGYNPKTVALYFEGCNLNLISDPIARFLVLFEKARQARLDRKPLHFYSSLYAVAECLSLPRDREIYSLQWKKTNADFMWPIIDGMQLIPDELFVLKLAIVDSIWALNPLIFCNADFSLWLNDTNFNVDFEHQAVRQVNWMLDEAENEIFKSSENGTDIWSILKAMKCGTWTRADLEEVTGLNNSPLTHAIHPALSAGWIERTEQKHSSQRQEYKITSKGLRVLSRFSRR